MQIANVKIKTRKIHGNNIKLWDNNPLFERRIQNATDGLSNDCFNWLERVANNNKDNVTVITNYNYNYVSGDSSEIKDAKKEAARAVIKEWYDEQERRKKTGITVLEAIRLHNEDLVVLGIITYLTYIT